MKRFVVVFMLLLTACNDPESDRPQPSEAVLDRPVLVCIGDSLTAGYQLPVEQAWPALLDATLPDWRVVNAGVSGDTSAGGLRRLPWILRSDPAVALICLGANDGLRGLELAETERNLAALISGLQEADVQVLLAGMQLPLNYGPEYRREFAQLYPRLAERFALPLLPFLLEGVAADPSRNLADGVHPNAAGHEQIAATVAAFIQQHVPEVPHG